MECIICNKIYKNKASLNKHQKKCKNIKQDNHQDNNQDNKNIV